MLFLLSFLGLFTTGHTANPVSWTFDAHVIEEGAVVVELKAKVEDGWHIYATKLQGEDGPVATSISFTPSASYVILGELQEPAPVEEYDPNFEMMVRHHSGQPRFALSIKPTANAPFVVEGEVVYMVCNSKTCLPPVAVPFRITVPAT